MENKELDKKIEEIIEQYCAPDTKLLLIGKYDHNLLKSALYQVAEYLQNKDGERIIYEEIPKTF